MLVLREGTRVKTKDELIGHIEARYDLGSVVYYIVRIDESGSLYKYFADQLTVIEEEPAPEEEPTAPDSITITREEFRNKGIAVITEIMKKEMTYGNINEAFSVTTLGAVICAKMELTLFGELKENV